MHPLQRLGPALVVAAVAGALLVPTGRAAQQASAAEPAAGARENPAGTATTRVVAIPVRPTVRRVPLTGIDRSGLAMRGAGRGARLPLAALSGAEPAAGFAVAGVTWRGPTPDGLALDIRTRTAGEWSAWSTMMVDPEHGPTPGSAEAERAIAGTDPYVAGAVDRVQVRATSRDGRVPRGLALSVVDPGASPADRARFTRDAEATTGSPAVAAPGATQRPRIYTRADWGADERMRGCCTEYGEVHAGFVHHTVNANDYTRAEVPAILRGIYAYHTQSRGWRDIGYNFLIDKFGRIWEGRHGGVALPVVGAHTLGYNENSFAASAIGNFQTARPRDPMLDAYARLYAWKLSLHGVRPKARKNVAGTVFDAISGHRDAAATACPGVHLYRRLPAIIDRAASAQRSFAGRDLRHSFIGSALPDLLTVDKTTGRVGMARGTGPPGFGPGRLASTTYAAYDQVAAVGDVTGDGRADLMVRNADTGSTTVMKGVGDATFEAALGSSRKWAATDLFAGPGDLDEDGRNDLVARDSASGGLFFYAGRPGGGFTAGTTVVTNLGGATALSGAGDFTSDGHADVLVRNRTGGLVVYAGDGAGHFPDVVRLSGNWAGKTQLTGGADLTGDGRPDVVARGSDGTTRIHANTGASRLARGIDALAAPMERALMSDDVTGDGRPDLITTTRQGSLVVYPGRQRNWFAPRAGRGLVWLGADRVLAVGDWNLDGHLDAMTKATPGTRGARLWLHPGLAAGSFGPRVGGWKGPAARRMLTPLGDFDGDGRPDLMSVAKDGRVLLHPGRGDNGFGAPVRMLSGLPDAVGIAAVGRWTADGAPDVVVQTRRGRLLLYPGNGPGGLGQPTSLGSRFADFQSLLGAGDLTGDGRADLIGRTGDGDLWLLAGVAPRDRRPAGTFGPRQYIGSGWSSVRLG